MIQWRLSDQNYPIHLQLSMKAYLLLKEEYPLCVPFLKAIPKSDKYKLNLEVNSLKPIERFIKDLEQEIEVLNEGGNSM